MKGVTIFFAALIALAMANPMWAQGMSKQKTGMQGMMMGQKGDSMCPMMGAGHMQGFFLKQAEALGLNDSQIEQLKKIKQETQIAVIKKEAAYRIAKLELKELMQNPEAKRSDVEAKAKKVEDLRSDIRLTEFNAKLDARAVLTPEQLKKAKSMKRGGMMKMHQGKNGSSPMMGNSNNDSKNMNDLSEHEKHHTKE
jgi:Spy/CpxP family protein refolding chaperone